MTTWIRWSVCALVMALGLCAVRAQTGPSWRGEWLARFNQERAEAGALPFRLSPVLCQVAQWQAEQMTEGVGAGYDAAPGGYRVIWVQSFGRGN